MKKHWMALVTLLLLSLLSKAQTFQQLNDQFIELYKQGKYKAAIPIGEKALLQAKKEFGDANLNYAIAAENLANAYDHDNNLPPALRYFQLAKKTYITVAGEDIIEVGLSNNAIGNIYLRRATFDSALTYFAQSYKYFLRYPYDQYDNLLVVAGNLCEVLKVFEYAKELENVSRAILPVIETKQGKASEAYLNQLVQLVVAFRNQQLTDSAMKRQQQVVSLSKKVHGENTGTYASMLDMLADLHRIKNEFAVAEKYLLQSRIIRTRLSTPDYYGQASNYHILANLYGDMARFEVADTYYDSSLQLMQQAGLQEDDMYTTVLRSKAYTDVTAYRLLPAKKSLLQLLNIYEKKFGKEYLGSAEILVTLGNVEYQINALSAALAHAAQGLAISTKYTGPETSLAATAYEVQGLAKHKMGSSAAGLLLCEKALAINKKILGEVHVNTASTLSNIGIIYQESGDYAAAEKVLRQSYIIRQQLLGNDHPQCAIAMNNLAAVLIMQSRFVDADKLLAASIEILKQRGMIGSSIALTTINNIALLMERQNDNATATKLYEQLLVLLKKDSVQNSTVLETVLSNLCHNSVNQQQYGAALQYGREAMAYTAKTSGKNSLGYIRAGNNCMVAHIKLRQYDAARSMAKEMESITKKILGDSAEILVKVYSNLSSLEAQSGNLPMSIQYLHQSLNLQTAHYEKNLYALSEKDQLAYWQQQAYLFQLFPSLLLAGTAPDTAMVSAMVNQQLRLKGFVLNNAVASLKKARSVNDPQLQQMLDAWQTSRTLYMQQSALPVAERSYSTDSLGILSNNLEQAINRKAGKNVLSAQSAVKWQQVQQALQPGEAAVEFLRYPKFDRNNYTDTMYFGAIVINKTGQPVLLPLGTEKQVQWCMSGGNSNSKETNISKLYRSRIKSKQTNASVFTGDSLYNLIWKPLMPLLKGVKIVSLAPDGLLHKVAFAALPISANALLLDSFQLQQYSSVRQLATQKNVTVALGTAVLQGYANFDKGSKAGSSGAWQTLPGTKQEIQALQQLLKSKGLKVMVDTGMQATEEAFKRLNGKAPAILHIATHGFFLPDPPAGHAADISQAVVFGQNSFARSQDPLMRSGIVLTGANQYWSGESVAGSKDDGILTAYEIAQTNLQGTQLAVLSACETGLGDVQDSEGVFGLQRALKMAGVKNMLLSLWQVPDAETMELMQLFYTQLLQGATPRKAFYQAQQTMRAKYPPFSWAAFVLME